MCNIRSTTLALSLLVAMGLTGCETAYQQMKIGRPSTPWDHSFNGTCTTDGDCKQKEAMAAVAAAQNYCTALREYYERGSEVSSSLKTTVGITGILAGSVFAVTSMGTASKAWAGLSGASNGVQTQINSNGSKQGSPEIIGEIAAVQENFTRETMTTFDDKSLGQAVWTKIYLQAMMLPDRCGAAAGKAIKELGNKNTPAVAVQPAQNASEPNANTPKTSISMHREPEEKASITKPSDDAMAKLAIL